MISTLGFFVWEVHFTRFYRNECHFVSFHVEDDLTFTRVAKKLGYASITIRKRLFAPGYQKKRQVNLIIQAMPYLNLLLLFHQLLRFNS